MLSSGRGGHANIVCTQPRRIAAVGVAERVAEERGEPIGRSVGYVIRGESKRSAASRLLFCTTGVLLKMLEDDHNLATVTHVVIDEVHERSCDSDLLLLMCRPMLARHKTKTGTVPQLKVVLMSATLDSAVFVKYFESSGLKVGVVKIEGVSVAYECRFDHQLCIHDTSLQLAISIIL